MTDMTAEKTVACVLVEFENGDTIAVDPVFCQLTVNGIKEYVSFSEGHMFTHKECEAVYLKVNKREAIVWDFNWKMYGDEPSNESPVDRLVGGANDIVCVGFRMIDETTDIYYVPWKNDTGSNEYEKVAVVEEKIMVSIEESADA